MKHIHNTHARMQALSTKSRLRLSALTDVLEAIADWRDDISAKLHRIDSCRHHELDAEVRLFRRLCFALGEYLFGKSAA
jgi:hypothetical protein